MSVVIAATLGLDQADMAGYRYQSTRSKQRIYNIGNDYFCVAQRQPPQFGDLEWKKYSDQFWAKKNKTVLWVASA